MVIIEKFKKNFKFKNKDEIDLFIENYDFYFDSSNSSHERHNQLVEQKINLILSIKKNSKKTSYYLSKISH